ncbi:MAG TPA: hypothetical protein PKX06_06430 [Phenylobacterium sp.]|nr:hypothetical protein [Phenylobacterium sp.]
MDSVLRRLGMFKFLRTKLTLLYAALFGVTLILVSVAGILGDLQRRPAAGLHARRRSAQTHLRLNAPV